MTERQTQTKLRPKLSVGSANVGCLPFKEPHFRESYSLIFRDTRTWSWGQVKDVAVLRQRSTEEPRMIGHFGN